MQIFFVLSQIYRVALGLIKPKVAPNSEIDVHYIVWPWRTEYCHTLQASEFLRFTDAGRWELAGRSGFLKAMWKQKAWAVVGGQKIIYRKAIPVFSRVTIKMRFAGYEDYFMYVEQRFFAKGELCALAYAKVAVRTGKGPIYMSKLFAELKSELVPISDEIKSIFGNDKRLLAQAARD